MFRGHLEFSHFGYEFDSLDHTQLVRDSLASNVERYAVINGCPDYW